MMDLLFFLLLALFTGASVFGLYLYIRVAVGKSKKEIREIIRRLKKKG